MDYSSFMNTPRWRILEILAKQPSSPTELALGIETSIAYVSQQLKLLEAANLVAKKRTGRAEKGKARTLFSLNGEMVYFVALINGSPFRKLLHLTEHHKIIMKIWLLENKEIHKIIEKIYLEIEEDIHEIKNISFNTKTSKLLIVSDSKKVKSKIESLSKHVNEKIECRILTENELKKIPKEEISPIYDPKKMFLDNELKGGNV
jgi:predicted transcriptional regulator